MLFPLTMLIQYNKQNLAKDRKKKKSYTGEYRDTDFFIFKSRKFNSINQT